ncbi:MAG: exonuclease domain-containing protein [Candidatus Omnitrophota bacterium]
MNKNIDAVEFTIFDTETTGLDPSLGDRIVEIAAVRRKGKEKLAEFQTLINPGRQISAAAFKVNHITPEMLKDAPQAAEVMPKFLDFIRGTCLCSYNAGFDIEFLNNELALCRAGSLDEVVAADILKMARRLLPGLERYALWFVADKLGVKMQQEHRAMSDVAMTIQVFDKLNAILEAKGVLDFHNFSGLFGLKSQLLDDLTNQKLAQIQQALDLKLKIKIKYLSGSSAAVTEREVIPKEVRKEYNHYYLIGYCCLKKEERSFRVDGILHLEVV